METEFPIHERSQKLSEEKRKREKDWKLQSMHKYCKSCYFSDEKEFEIVFSQMSFSSFRNVKRVDAPIPMFIPVLNTHVLVAE